MRAVVCRQFTTYHDLKLEQVPEPDLGPGAVLIDVKAAGVSFATSLVVSGRYQRKPPLPFSPGTEIAGVVLEVAPDVTRFRPGDRVYAHLDWGGHAQQVVARAIAVQPLPDALSFAAGTALPASYGTALGALTWATELKPGETLLVHAAAGALGSACVQVGRALGARVIGTAGDPAKRALASRAGCDAVVDYGEDDWPRQVKDLTDGRGVDVVADPVGGKVAELSLRALAQHGRLLTLGYTSGAIPALPANLLLVKNLSAIGFNYGTYLGWSPNDERVKHAPAVAALHRRLHAWAEAGLVRPFVSHRFPLAQFTEALETVLGRRALGKVVLDMALADDAAPVIDGTAA
ncbi:MAG: NADPH:quinone oxidoreductase family protein [Alphaproteobacteria bacterium]